MSLTPSGYRSRLMEDKLKFYLEAFGAVEVRGPRWCGKTWMSLSVANSVTKLDDPAVRESVELDARLALHGQTPHLVDEWQEVPAVWDATRRAVDESAGDCGRFLLTGSSAPNMDKVAHSGAGRIARLRMEPMTLFELGLSSGTVSLESLLCGDKVETAQSDLDFQDLVDALCQGGWPAAIGKSKKYQSVITKQYLDAFLDSVSSRSASDRDNLDSAYMRRILYALARNDGGSASIDTLTRDAMNGEDFSSNDRATTNRYLSFVEENYMLRSLRGWDAPVKSRARTRTRPKRYLVDPSLTASLLGYDAERLLLDRQLLGILFENMCIRDLSVYLNASTSLQDPQLFYYRDSYGLEVDVIIETVAGKWAALEVKLDVAKADDAATNLLRLRDKVASNPLAQNPEPAFLGIIVANAPYFFQRPDGVYVIPVGCLGR